MRTSPRHRDRRPPVVTLTPRSTVPTETWQYSLPSGHGGVIVGDLAWAAWWVFLLAHNRRWPRVVLRFPKARCGGLRDQTIAVSSPEDLHQLRTVDVEAVVWRHGLRVPGREQLPLWRWWLRGWPDLGAWSPQAWPAVL